MAHPASCICLDWNEKRPYLDRSDFYERPDSAKLRSFSAGLPWLTEDSLTLRAIAAWHGEWKRSS
ncbi:MAG: hypothetical protein SFW36_24145 [Leptolyngbyaceae cyanobacterium bins.59]|nr:hypothetical protein [Leptolyngbyaceae cyanobacterium bins.59]